MFRKNKRKKEGGKRLKKKWYLGFLPIEFFDSLKRQQLISPGFLLTILILFSPVIIWLGYGPDSIRNPVIGLAKFNAFMAISTLSVNFILSTRLKVFEHLFYGLDRMYRVHKVVGRTSLIFIILHPLFLIVSAYPNVNVISTYVLPIGELEIAAGVLSLYLFLLLIALTVAIKIPYHLWHNSHKLLGIVLLAAGFHALVAGSDINSFFWLKTVIASLCGIGLISWLYMLIFYKITGPKYKVTLKKVLRLKDITELYLDCPEDFDYQPGQFVFIRFPKFEGYKELFPFSISTDPAKTYIRLSIKKSGDYTSNNVPKLREGDRAIIMGPYGRFGQRYLKHEKDMVWIAGGIGITPFLSLAKHESLYPTGRKIHLIWVVRNLEDAFHDRELIDEALKNDNFTYTHWFSADQGRITGERIKNMMGSQIELKKRLIFMCGPPGMMYGLSKSFHQFGISYRNIIFEDFNMLD